jgi:hypothetical protein
VSAHPAAAARGDPASPPWARPRGRGASPEPEVTRTASAREATALLLCLSPGWGARRSGPSWLRTRAGQLRLPPAAAIAGVVDLMRTAL